MHWMTPMSSMDHKSMVKLAPMLLSLAGGWRQGVLECAMLLLLLAAPGRRVRRRGGSRNHVNAVSAKVEISS